jgi:hypothetical protein
LPSYPLIERASEYEEVDALNSRQLLRASDSLGEENMVLVPMSLKKNMPNRVGYLSTQYSAGENSVEGVD